MARYVNIYKEKRVVIRKAYDGDDGYWISEHECMVAIETDDGRLIEIPVMDEEYLRDYTADEYLKEYVDEDIRSIMLYDCPARDNLIKENLTQWICNEGCVSGCGFIESVCAVISLLERHGMWKKEYAKSIDVEMIKKIFRLE